MLTKSGRNPVMRIAILISGRGSNMQSLVYAARKADIDITLIAANTPCAGLDFAEQQALPHCLVNRSEYPDKISHEDALAAEIEKASPDWIFLAGYMAVLSADFIDRFDGRIINIHPSLLPDFKGLNTHQRALDAAHTTHGASIHLVTSELDGGEVIIQAETPIRTYDADELAAHILQIEHLLYPAVLLSLCSGKLTIEDGVISWLDKHYLPSPGDAEISRIICLEG